MKIMKYFWLLSALLALHSQLFAQAQKLSLAQCMNQIDSLWPSGQNIQLNQEKLNYQLKNAKNSWKPSLTLNAQATYQSSTIELNLSLPVGNLDIPSPDKDQYKAYLDVKQMIWDGGISKAQQDLYKIQSKSTDLNIQSDINKAKKQVSELYFGILQVQQNEKILQQTENELSTKIKTLSSAVNNGIASSIELEKLQIQALKLNQSKHEVKSAKQALYVSLSTLLSDTKIDSSTLLYLPDFEISKSMLEQSTTYQQFKNGIDQLSIQNNILKKSRSPKVIGFAQLGYGKPGLNMLSNSFDPYFIVGLSAQWKIWDFSYKNNRQIIEIQQKTIDNTSKSYLNYLSSFEKKISQEIEKYDYLIQKDKEIVEKQAEILKKSSMQLDKGIISASDYIEQLFAEAQAKLSLELHKLQKIKTKSDYNTLNENYSY